MRVTFHDLGANAHDDAANSRLLGLLGDRGERFFQRQSGSNQRCDLSRE